MSLKNIFARLRGWLWAGEPTKDEEISAEDLVAFQAYAHQFMSRLYPPVALCFLVALMLFWPTDWFVFAEDQQRREALWDIRVAGVLTCLIAMALYGLTPWIKRFPVFFGVFFGYSIVFYTAFRLSDLGGPGTQQISTLYFVSAFSLFMQTKLWLRSLVALGVSAVALVGFLSPNPHYLGHPLIPTVATHLLFTTLVFIALGHTFYRLILRNFVQRQRLAAQREQLQDLNQNLESQVDERTEELHRLTQGLESAIKEEREYIAREIHDQLGQQIWAIRYAVTWAKKKAKGLEDVEMPLGDIENLLNQSRVTMRRIMSRLKPQVLEQLGLEKGAKWLLDDVAERTELDTNLTIRWGELSEEDLDGKIATTLFAVLQEGLNNVVRHANASRVDVLLEIEGNVARVKICDDGVGLPEDTSPTSVGMIGIRERTRALGGRAEWTSTPDQGVTLIVEIPIG